MNIPSQFRKLLLVALSMALAPLSHGEIQETGEGSLQMLPDGETKTPRILPLKHTEVKVEISGFVAEVEVTQIFENPAEKPIEAIYVFPLPENAAVNKMTLTVGDRIIKGQIKKREEARKIYEQAKSDGKIAALLDEERPNIFTQSVANIPPGKEIRVTLRYLQDLPYDHSVYKFVFPMVVGPRYIPGKATGAKDTGGSPDTSQVPDASRITPPVLRPGERSGHNISLRVTLNAGVPIKNIRSSSHDISVRHEGESGAEILLDPSDSIPNKDFTLSYEPSGKAVEVAALAHRTGKEGYLTLMIQPRADFPLSHITPKELVFAIDVSGSMSGFPVETAKELARRCLEGMNPNDTFQILSFASGNKLHFERPLKNTPKNIARARQELNALHGSGGTEMLEALRTALEFPKDPARLRIVLFMTDGYIGNEKDILSFIQKHLNNSRIFPLGVGSSVNRYLLEEMAVMGKGVVQYVRFNEKPARLQEAIDHFYGRISKPYLTDLAVDWRGLDVREATPARLPDVFANQPIFLHARYEKSGSAQILLRGKFRGKPWAMPVIVHLPEKEPRHRAMGPLWARARMTELSRAMFGGEEEKEKVEKITRLALQHQLVSAYTSFVAVDESPAVAKGEKPMVVPVPVELPEGTVYEGFFGPDALMNPKALHRMGSTHRFVMNGLPAPSPAPNLEEKSRTYETLPIPPTIRQERVASLAEDILRLPSRSLARQLISLQSLSGAFLELDGKEAPLPAQALATLAIAKARSLFGAEIEEALQRAWKFLKARLPNAPDAETALKNILTGSPHESVAGKELTGLSETLRRLR